MRFSEQDKDLVEIIEAIGGVTMEIHSGQLNRQERKTKEAYAQVLLETYVNQYYQFNSELPGKGLFGEAINDYVKQTFEGKPFTLSKTIKGMMRNFILYHLDKYKKTFRNGHYAQRPKLAFG